MEIFKEFTFDSAHYLPNVPDDHKCRRMHGHTYRIRLYVGGPLHPELGWIMDFADVKAAWKPLEAQLDHRVLNDIPGLENPTAENLAIWIWREVRQRIPNLTQVDVYENPTAGVVYRGAFEMDEP